MEFQTIKIQMYLPMTALRACLIMRCQGIGIANNKVSAAVRPESTSIITRHKFLVERGKIIFMAVEETTYKADNATGINHEGPTANTPVERLTATSILGDRVESTQGEDLGKIDNLMINLGSGEIEYAVVEFGSFLGIGGKLFAVPFKELRVDAERRIFVLSRDKEYLRQSPGFDKDHWPDTNDHSYFDNVKMYYGSYLPPYP